MLTYVKTQPHRGNSNDKPAGTSCDAQGFYKDKWSVAHPTKTKLINEYMMAT